MKLTSEQRQELNQAIDSKSLSGRLFKRLQGVKLNAQGYSAKAVSDLLQVHYNSVCNWLRRYEQEGLAGLAERAREGRPRRLDAEQARQVRAWVEQEPRQLKLVLTKVEEEFDLDISLETLKRVLKREATATGE